MVLGLVMKKRLFVRHCGNWYVQQTKAEKFWKWFMERFGSSENLMLATGGADEPPSKTNPHIRWIFSTTLTEKEICALREKRKELKPSKRLVIVCRQEKAKGTETVIRALQLIAAKYPDVQLDVVGDGSALGYFKSLAKELEIDSRLLFHGNVCHEKVIQILCQASIFCFPTKSSEGFPKAVLEALAAGVPVIATRVSVLPYLLRNGCGLLMDDGTPQELAEFASNLLSDDRRWLRMSETALATAKEYTLERWKESIRDALFGSRQACHTAGIFS
jgi:glycosyltransferase involved in cell wall biosynthesis